MGRREQGGEEISRAEERRADTTDPVQLGIVTRRILGQLDTPRHRDSWTARHTTVSGHREQ